MIEILLLQYIVDYYFFIGRSTTEQELSIVKMKLSAKERDFARSAGDLEQELDSLQFKLKTQQQEKSQAAMDKESLLEEVIVICCILVITDDLFVSIVRSTPG